MFFKKSKGKIEKVAEDKQPISNEGFKLTLHNEKNGEKFIKLSDSFGISEERLDILNTKVQQIINSSKNNKETAFASIYMAESAKVCHTLEELSYVMYSIGEMMGRNSSRGNIGGIIHIALGGIGKGSTNQQEDEDGSIDALIKKSEKINGKPGEPRKDEE